MAPGVALNCVARHEGLFRFSAMTGGMARAAGRKNDEAGA
jgi:hypothetical protein